MRVTIMVFIVKKLNSYWMIAALSLALSQINPATAYAWTTPYPTGIEIARVLDPLALLNYLEFEQVKTDSQDFYLKTSTEI